MLSIESTRKPVLYLANSAYIQFLFEPGPFDSLGAEPTPGTPEEFGAVMRKDAEKSGRLIKAAGLRAE